MINTSAFIFLASFLLGCATASTSEPSNLSIFRPKAPAKKNFMDPAVIRYVKDFERLTGKSVDIYIGFEKDLDDNDIGQCWEFKNGYAEIILDSDYFDDSTILQRRALVLHELGHCILGWNHNDTIRTDGCPVSLMYYKATTQKCLRTHWSSYESEFKNTKNNDRNRRHSSEQHKQKSVQGCQYRE